MNHLLSFFWGLVVSFVIFTLYTVAGGGACIQ